MCDKGDAEMEKYRLECNHLLIKISNLTLEKEKLQTELCNKSDHSLSTNSGKETSEAEQRLKIEFRRIKADLGQKTKDHEEASKEISRLTCKIIFKKKLLLHELTLVLFFQNCIATI